MPYNFGLCNTVQRACTVGIRAPPTPLCVCYSSRRQGETGLKGPCLKPLGPIYTVAGILHTSYLRALPAVLPRTSLACLAAGGKILEYRPADD